MKTVFASGLAILLLSGCAIPLPGSGGGSIFTEVTEAVQANNAVEISRRGEACSTNILGIVSTGDSTVEKAMRNANVSRVATIDRYFYSILLVYAKACTQVAGN